jgi:hypothetical protein
MVHRRERGLMSSERQEETASGGAPAAHDDELQKRIYVLSKKNAALQEKIDFLEWVLEPRLLSILTLRPLRHVLNERNRRKNEAPVEAAAADDFLSSAPATPKKKPSIYDNYTVTKPLGIAVFGYDRADIVFNTLKSLDAQGAIENVVVYIDGDQKRFDIDKVEEVARSFNVAEIYRNRGNYGFRKMMLLAMKDMMARYERILFLEDDCFPTGAALKGFSKEIDRIENDTSIFSVYGHPFLVERERAGEPFPRFQGWGWATTREKLAPIHEKLLECYLMPERDYLAYVGRTLTPELKRNIDATPGRQPSDTIEKFFAWDETLGLLVAAAGMSHLCSQERIIYNCGAGDGASHFTNAQIFRDPPFNLITPKEVWDYF